MISTQGDYYRYRLTSNKNLQCGDGTAYVTIEWSLTTPRGRGKNTVIKWAHRYVNGAANNITRLLHREIPTHRITLSDEDDPVVHLLVTEQSTVLHADHSKSYGYEVMQLSATIQLQAEWVRNE